MHLSTFRKICRNIYVEIFTKASHVGLYVLHSTRISVSLRQVGQWRKHFETLDIGIARR